jgi:hypothetical protein
MNSSGTLTNLLEKFSHKCVAIICKIVDVGLHYCNEVLTNLRTRDKHT